MTERPVTFKSGELALEGLLARPDVEALVAVVCHPHPMYGGSMHNNVVEAILAALWQRGYATLRFNFRGVGNSEGEYDGGPGEVDDATAALAFMLSQPETRKAGALITGYSFGAMVATGAGYESADVAGIVAVALPLAMTDVRIPAQPKPTLLVSGDRDSYSPVDGLKMLQQNSRGSIRLEIIAGADHFFGGRESELSRTLINAIPEF